MTVELGVEQGPAPRVEQGPASVVHVPDRDLAGPRPAPSVRPRAEGPFLFAGEEKLVVRGVAYGPLALPPHEYGDPDAVRRDFEEIAASGFNCVRTYTAPPGWMLDAALEDGLWVIAGHAWEQHVDVLGDRRLRHDIERRLRREVRGAAGHPAVLCHVVGNEVPSALVRWQGGRRTERFLAGLCRAVRDEDPDALMTYANYPSTEYLEVPGLDLVCFNVFLEAASRFEAYVTRLQHLAGDRPLLLGEIGLDSNGHGEGRQAELLAAQVRAARRSGCAGTVVFAWTDRWHRGGAEVEGWAFGLTRRDGTSRPALAAVSATNAEPVSTEPSPRVSVVVCTHNGERTIRDCLSALAVLDYPDYEVVVVDDGSTDGTAEIAAASPFRLIRTEHRGLARARNTGLWASTGTIVAYLDDDAYPDAGWLRHLVPALASGEHVGMGGPNVPPPGGGAVAEAVARSPGGPVHVMLSDREAEHIPGCNMAFRREALLAIGGFDPCFRTAGDDVDVCWRLQERGWTLGFSPGAVVWHHRRSRVAAYWRQQRGYGRAEALLERKWPQRYNAAGHHPWTGRVYGGALGRVLAGRWRVYHGIWGAAPFQRRDPVASSLLAAVPRMPEWYLVLGALAALSAAAAVSRARVALLALALTLAAGVAWTVLAGWRAAGRASGPPTAVRLRVLTTMLHLLQPPARLVGRVGHGLTPWRSTALGRVAVPRTRRTQVWAERWRPGVGWVEALERALRDGPGLVVCGGEYDHWDLEVRGGTLGAARLAVVVEDHDGGRQLARFRSCPRLSPGAVLVGFMLTALAAGAGAAGAPVVAAALGAGTLALWATMLRQAAVASGAAVRAMRRVR